VKDVCILPESRPCWTLEHAATLQGLGAATLKGFGDPPERPRDPTAPSNCHCFLQKRDARALRHTQVLPLGRGFPAHTTLRTASVSIGLTKKLRMVFSTNA
jgi:hypothetical protein